jgi:Protein of unknown function (DUF2628)
MSQEHNPFAVPQAPLQDVPVPPPATDIASLPVSDTWKLRFMLMQKAGGPSMRQLKALSFSERMKISFNFLAFLFGPLYYVSKGMWKKGLAFFVACVVAATVLGVVLELMGLGRIANALGYGFAAVFASRANVDYYKKMVLQENGWW